MKHYQRFTLRAGLIALLAVAGLLAARPAAAAGPVAGVDCSAGCTLTAGAGSFALPGQADPVNILGYTADGSAPAQPGGPVLTATAGQPVSITLVNNLAAATSLTIAGTDLEPDLTGVAPGASKTYTFTPAEPGTYLYEAGLITGGAKQLALGLYGALIVRPAAAGQLTADAASAFTDEAVLVLGELDPRLNADPAGFDLREFKAEYFLVNGQVYPGLPAIDATAGQGLALRFINAGLTNRTVGLLGLDMTVFAQDGTPLAFPRRALAEALHPGESADALAALPASAPVGAQFPLFETGLLYTRNANEAGLGGMFTLVNVASSGAPAPAAAGPVVSSFAAAPNPTTGAFPVEITAAFSGPVTAAEYYVDQVGGPISGTLTLDGAGTAGTATLSPAVLGPLAAAGETHPIFVRAQDANGWGAFNSVILDLYTAGPAISSLNFDFGGLDQTGTQRNPTNGVRNINLYGTASTGHEDPNGSVHVMSAEYAITGSGVAGPLALNLPDTTLSGLTAQIPSSALQALPEGIHTVAVTGVDSLNNTGQAGTVELYLDKTGPAVTGVTISPDSHVNGVAVNTYAPAVRVSVTFADPLAAGVQSNIVWGEMKIDGLGAAIPFIPRQAVFTGPTEPAYADIPLTTIAQLSEGAHTLQIRGKDAAGNWGPLTPAQLVVDKTGPVVSNVTAVKVANPRIVRVTAQAADPVVPGAGTGSKIVRAEWFRGTDPGIGNGFAITNIQPANSVAATLTFTTPNLPNGVSILSVRALDVAGNWGQVVTHLVQFSGGTPIILASDFTAARFADWAGAVGTAQLRQVQPQGGAEAAAAAGHLQVTVKGAAPAYVYDYSPLNATVYGATFQFNPLDTAGLGGEAVEIFTGRGRSAELFSVQYEDGAGGPEIRACVAVAGGSAVCTAWQHVSAGAHTFGLIWRAGSGVAFSLSVDGQTVATLTGLETAAFDLYEVRLGAQGAGLHSGLAGTLDFAQFVSTAAPHTIFVPLITR